MFHQLGGTSGAVLHAVRIAVEAHAGQFRDDGVTPFIYHPLRVALRVAEDVAMFGRDLLDPYTHDETVAAAVLHDVLEDVPEDRRPTWEARILAHLGKNVLQLAILLRNPSKDLPKHTPRAEKKALDRDHYRAPTLPAAVRLVKLCDRPDNLSEMTTWTLARIGGYAEESEGLLDAILSGLWQSAECHRYGMVATQNAFRVSIERYKLALVSARDRAAGKHLP